MIERLIEASRGRALVLFTSYRHLDFVAGRIAIPYLQTPGGDAAGETDQMVQGDPGLGPPGDGHLLAGDRHQGGCLEPGHHRPAPLHLAGDPVYQERCSRLGDRWFYDLALPTPPSRSAGFGRLIRGSDERGVVAVLDTGS